MKREEAIKILSTRDVHGVLCGYTGGYTEALDMAIDALNQTAWIPVSEKLPEKDELVLVTVWNDVVIAWRNLYGGWESAEDIYGKGDVTAWKPLPEPYKGGENND